MKLVDTPDLGSGAVRCVGSSPILGTSKDTFPKGKCPYFILNGLCGMIGSFYLSTQSSEIQNSITAVFLLLKDRNKLWFHLIQFQQCSQRMTHQD